MREVKELSRRELEVIVEEIREILYLVLVQTEPKTAWKRVWNPTKEWDSETLEYINRVLDDYRLIPEEGENAGV